MNQKYQLVQLARLSRVVYGDNAVEFLIGALSSLTSESQINVLIDKLNDDVRELVRGGK